MNLTHSTVLCTIEPILYLQSIPSAGMSHPVPKEQWKMHFQILCINNLLEGKNCINVK